MRDWKTILLAAALAVTASPVLALPQGTSPAQEATNPPALNQSQAQSQDQSDSERHNRRHRRHHRRHRRHHHRRHNN